MSRALKALSVAIGLFSSTMVFAEHEYGPQYGSNERYDYAEVVAVDPIIETVRDSVPREVCWNEQVRVPQRGGYYQDRRDNTGATVLGAIIGGALGNTAGHGRGRRASTIAGAVIGGAIGNSVGRNNDQYYGHGRHEQNRYAVRSERQCRVENDFVEREQVVGYDVSYRYNGQVFHTQTDAHPGNRIRVEVQVRPVG